MPSPKRILIIAGPNGAGKTTLAREFLLNEADCPTFINADLIAAGLNPFHPDAAAIQAGRLMLSMITDYVGRGDSFAFETTLSGRGYARLIPRWQAQGYRVTLFFLRLPTPETAISRVGRRVVRRWPPCAGRCCPPPLPRRTVQLRSHLPGSRRRVGLVR